MYFSKLHLPSAFNGKFLFPVSAAVLWAFSACQVVAANNPSSARLQVETVARQAVNQAVHQQAKRQQWQDWQLRIALFVAQDVANYPRCATTPEAQLSGLSAQDFSRMKVNVRCTGALSWQTTVTVKPEILLPVVTARHGLPREHLLTAQDLVMKKQNIVAIRGGYETNIEKITGFSVKRRLREGQVVSLQHVDKPQVISRGQQVTLVASQQGIEARTQGEALQNGRAGGMIRVKNLSSDRIVLAQVVSAGLVKVVEATEE
ncbi:flagellar basal body P-ring formation chaperone FlgA [Mangrovibacter plantisponsor]|uniref:Flagella basal body P-ring formation protein FlgA n=1 Tax=Mangrovibacter plantisponsor TaxID=451513 RepID=A0A317PJN0_9ENTR|nr:flagellar basal body P-ring formation chaperone FlgA [Mangrovibacter plantisponsor]PWW00827.1 flagella basal body P-ring formation protein FlgA [Mangrovibacter plantisponsor]